MRMMVIHVVRFEIQSNKKNNYGIELNRNSLIEIQSHNYDSSDKKMNRN